MFKSALLGTSLFVVSTVLGLAVFGQPQKDAPGSVASRDNFHSKTGKLERLTPAELEKEVEAEFADKRNKRKSAANVLQDPQFHDAVPPHRLSRDAVSSTSFAKATAAKKKSKEFQITLKNATIEKYKNRATLATAYQVIRSRVHVIAEDGDMHVAGLADEVGLPCVAEIMNIRNFPNAAQFVKKLEKTKGSTSLTGVFRLWCEHPDSHGNGPQIQDDVIPDYVDSNPAHVFEIHPVTRIGTIDVLDSFAPIPDEYEHKEATPSFKVYESLPCRIVLDADHQTTTLFTAKVGNNYVKFKLRVDEDQHLLTFDTRIVRCSVLTLDDKELVNDRRMVFVQNSPPEKKVRGKKSGETLVVMGMPRVDLAVISWRVRNADVRPDSLTWNLPYEMVIVGVYDDQNARLWPSSRRGVFARSCQQVPTAFHMAF